MAQPSLERLDGDAAPPAAPAIDAAALGRKARLGVVILVIRTVVMQFTVLGGNVVLARLLEPAEFGVFAIAQFAVTFFSFFGDAGLGGALVQKRDEPTQGELSSVFFVQIAVSTVAIVLVGVAAGAAHWVWPDLPPGSSWLLRALSVELLLTALRVVPSILMERKLEYGRLALLEIVVAVSFYASASVLAWMGLKVWALVASVLVQGVAGVVMAYALHPWRPSAVFDREALRPIVRFGIPYQLKNVIGLVLGAVMPVYAGSRLGAGAVGFINWAQTTAFFPLKLVEIMGRVAFPLFSRLRGDATLFAGTLGRAIHVCAMGTFFFVALMLGLGGDVIHVIFTDKWMPALPLLRIYTVAITIGFVTPVIASAFDASGRPQLFVRLSLVWTGLIILVVPFTTARWGMAGFALGYCSQVVVGNLLVLWVTRSLVPGVRFLRRTLAPAAAGAVAYGVARFWLAGWARGWASLASSVVLLAAVYAFVILAVDRRGVVEALSIVPRERTS